MAKPSEKAVFDLIGQIYESATQTDSDGWYDVFEKLCRLLSSGPGSLHFFVPRDQRYESIANNMPPGFTEAFASTYFHILPFKEEIIGLKQGESFLRSRDCTDDMYVPSELYQEHYQKLGIFHMFHVNLMEMDGASAGITFTRPEGMNDYGRAELDAFWAVYPHLKRAMQMYVKFLEADGRNSMFESAWNRVPQGMVLVTESGKIAFMNEAAKGYFGAGKPLKLDRSGLIAAPDSSQTSRLRNLIASVFNTSSASAGVYGGSMKLNAASFGRPLSLLVTPFTERFGTSGLFERQAMMFINDPLNNNNGSDTDLRMIYGLTPTEARVALLLADGHSTRQISEMLGIAENTTRTHLKRVFGKTDTNRQGSLIKLILATSRNHH